MAFTEFRDTKAPYGDVPYADPGYLDADGNQASKSGKPGVKRYALSPDKVMAAWSYINQKDNAGQYTPAQLSAIKGKIRSAMKQHGHTVSDSDSDGRSAWATEPERRFTPGAIEVRAAMEGQKIGGYGAVFGKLSRNLGGFVELVDTGAFSQARNLGWPNVVCRYNHDPNMVLGTTAGRTLQLRTDNVGLDYEVLPPQSRQDILELVERGDVQYSSFAFRVPPGGDEWRTTDQNYPMRVLHEVQLVDVAPVLDPAYPDASAGLRSLAAAMSADPDEVRSLAAADELRRFFQRTDRPSGPPPPPKPRVKGPEAMMRLMEKRFPKVG
jgi:Escherichia/Staphylococcus phage prohead protease